MTQSRFVQMYLIMLILLLQGQRLSLFVIVGLVLAFVVGLSLLVYFFYRFRQSDKEADEDWSLLNRGLFGPGPAQSTSPELSGGITDETKAGRGVAPPRPEPIGSQLVEHQPDVVPKTEQQPPAPSPSLEQQPRQQYGSDASVTQMLASAPGPLDSANNESVGRPQEDTPFDAEVWHDIDQEARAAVPASRGESQSAELWTAESPPDQTARVEQRTIREPFEAPRLERINRREPYEAPSMEPLEPGDEGEATRALTSPPPNPVYVTERTIDQNPDSLATSRARPPATVAASLRNAPMGSLLGIAAERTDKPLVLGKPVRGASEIGIGSLSQYGKETGPESGWGGTIALVATIIVVAGLVLAYLQIPAVNARVNAWVARVRGDQLQATSPKAQIFPARSEADKNIVKASGSVTNISNEPLSDVSIEVILQGATSSTRNITVEPAQIQPQNQARYQFEYDGKEYAAGYKINKLIAGGREIPFARPPQGTASR
jgi:hypothetical protein